MQRYDEALIQMNKAIELDPRDIYDNIYEKSKLFIYLILNLFILSFKPKGKVYMKMSDYHNAIEYFNKAIELNPWRLYSRFYKGKCLKRLNRIDEAITCCEETIRFSDEFMLLCDEFMSETNAIKEKAYFLLSKCLLEQKDYELALDAINKATEIDTACKIYTNEKYNISKGNLMMIYSE